MKPDTSRFADSHPEVYSAFHCLGFSCISRKTIFDQDIQFINGFAFWGTYVFGVVVSHSICHPGSDIFLVALLAQLATWHLTCQCYEAPSALVLPQSSQAVPITASTSSVREHRLTEAAAGSRLTTSAKALASSFLGRVGKVPVEANTEVLDTGVSLTSHFNMSLTGKRESVPCGGEEQSQGGGRTEAGCRRMDCLLQTLIVLRSRCFLPRFKRSCCSEKDSRESIASSEGAYSGREICLLPSQGKVTCQTLC